MYIYIYIYIYIHTYYVYIYIYCIPPGQGEAPDLLDPGGTPRRELLPRESSAPLQSNVAYTRIPNLRLSLFKHICKVYRIYGVIVVAMSGKCHVG